MEIERLTDTDVTSLDARITETLERIDDDCVVVCFTHFFTGRMPVHEARVLTRA